MIKKTSSFCFLLFLFLSSNTTAQNADIGNWFIYLGNQKIYHRFNWHNEVQYRNYNFIGDLEQLLLRTGIGYDLTENNNNVLVGVAYILSEPYVAVTDEKSQVNEFRIYEQFITKSQFGRVYMLNRYRFEQRFIEGEFKMRMRYYLSLNVPLNKKLMEKNAFYASAYNEIFINLDPITFDRDRVYGGFGYCINKNFRVEAGIMSQLFTVGNSTQFQIMIINNLPFK